MRCYLHELKSCHTVKTIMSDPALSLLRGIYVYQHPRMRMLMKHVMYEPMWGVLLGGLGEGMGEGEVGKGRWGKRRMGKERCRKEGTSERREEGSGG